MMTNDDVPRGMSYPQGRKPVPPNSRYSPSPSYNYNYNTNSSFPSQQQHLRRKMDRFKRDGGNGNGNERLMRQNDLIIRLLKEIRDRLPPPPVSAPVNGSDTGTTHQTRLTEEMPGQELQTPAPEAGNQTAAVASVNEAPRTEAQPLDEGNPEAE
jgi:hypothetical protein